MLFAYIKIIIVYIPTSQQTENRKHLYNICAASAQRLRRWPNTVQMLYKCFAFTGMEVQLYLSNIDANPGMGLQNIMETYARFSSISMQKLIYIEALFVTQCKNDSGYRRFY